MQIKSGEVYVPTQLYGCHTLLLGNHHLMSFNSCLIQLELPILTSPSKKESRSKSLGLYFKHSNNT